MKEKVFILGARRGLGAQVLASWVSARPQDVIFASSRKPFESSVGKTRIADLTVDSDIQSLIEVFHQEKPTRIFYIAGGGPYGDFASKDWKDHEWSLKLSLLTPAKLIYEFLKMDFCQQMIVVGSAIAENAPDPKASSYAAAKHGLHGLVRSLRGEMSKDLRLFSPGYMKTDMIPSDTLSRHKNVLILDPQKVAAEFVDWALNPQASWHYQSRPSL